MSRSWWSEAVIYAVDAGLFQDSNGDGSGDLVGLRRRLDHVQELGATVVWLLPFYESPNRDGRYDVSDHRKVDPALGSQADFENLVEEIHRRGLRLVIDLIANHTSDQHEWFRRSREGDPRYRDHYVWRDEPDDSLDVYPIFPGVSDSVWTFDQEAGRYYLHRFYDHEPDLNTASEHVQEEILQIARHWLEAGVDGFRLDAAPYVARKAGWGDGSDGMEFLARLSGEVRRLNAEALLIPEADVEPEGYPAYLDSGMDLVLDFATNNRLFLALARRDATPLKHIVESQARGGTRARLVQWIRNHDELDLERLSEEERAEVFRRFAPDPDSRVYDRGIRRRLPPMVGGERPMVELATSLVFALPGVPVLRYGEEIGMGDDLSLPERRAVRTVMQWNGQRGAGFSDAPEDRWVSTLVTEGPFSFERVNVADQEGDPGSLLHWVRRLVEVRRNCAEIGGDTPALLDTPPAVLALQYRQEGGDLLVAHNLGEAEQSIEVPARSHELFPARGPLESEVRIPPAGCRWVRLPAAD